MNRPPLIAYLIGNTPVALGVVGLGLFALYQCWTGELNWPAGLAAVLAMSACINASERISQYRSWKRAWDAMEDAPPVPPRPWKEAARRLLGLALLALGLAYMVANRNAPEYQLGLAAMIVLLAAAVIIWIVQRWRRVRRADSDSASDPIVAISVTAPLIAVPHLRVAFQRLPDHCLRALRGPPADDASPG